MYAALSENYGNISQKLNLFLAFAPIVNLSGTTNSMMQAACAHNKGIEDTANFIRLWEIRSPKLDNAMHSFCFWFGSVCNGIT